MGVRKGALRAWRAGAQFFGERLTQQWRHVPALDGVRGLAIVLVVFRHLSLLRMGTTSDAPAIDRIVHTVASVGWIGVDLFFVLSGFLITGILLDAKGTRGAFRRFWKRRALRIFPLYYVACTIMFVLLPHVGYFARDPAMARFTHEQGWYWLYGVNVLEVLRGGVATPFNTAHFWSLAVEEQFYLAWPFVVLMVSRKALWRVVIGMSIAALAFRIALILFLPGGWAAAYMLSVARMDILGAGALVALIVRTPRAATVITPFALPSAIAAVALLVLFALCSGSGFSNTKPYIATIGYSLLAIAGACLMLVILAERDGRLWKRVLEGPTLRVFGKYSYCIYLVHYPIMMVLDALIPKFRIPPVRGSTLPAWTAYAAVLFGLSLATAWISWRVLEEPALALK